MKHIYQFFKKILNCIFVLFCHHDFVEELIHFELLHSLCKKVKIEGYSRFLKDIQGYNRGIFNKFKKQPMMVATSY